MKEFIISIITALTLTACINYNDATTGVAVKVQLELPANSTGSATLEGQTVVMSNASGNVMLKAMSDEQGVVTFTDITPDVYNISVSWEITPEEYHQMTGDNQVIRGCTLSGSLNSYLIKEDQTITLPTLFIINRDIVIGKIYYAGAKDNNNTNYLTGSYLELFNQADDTIDASGLYIGLVEADSQMAYTLDNLHEQHADSVVLLKQVFRIPADADKQVPPGGTLLLVNSAIDHSQYSPMEHSLLDADFEAKDVNMRYTNNPSVPALEAIYLQQNTTMSNMNLTRGGPCGVVIFHTDEDVSQWPRTYKYPNTETKGAQWVLLSKRLIIDGVDLLKYKAAGVDIQTKRLYPEIDAGYFTLTSVNGLTGEVVYRKTASRRSASGHLLLEDTNNSSNDFHVSTTIKPRQYDE